MKIKSLFFATLILLAFSNSNNANSEQVNQTIHPGSENATENPEVNQNGLSLEQIGKYYVTALQQKKYLGIAKYNADQKLYEKNKTKFNDMVATLENEGVDMSKIAFVSIEEASSEYRADCKCKKKKCVLTFSFETSQFQTAGWIIEFTDKGCMLGEFGGQVSILE